MLFRNDAALMANLVVLTVTNVLVLSLCFYYYVRIYRRRTQINQEVAARNPTIITNQFFREFWFWLTDPILRLLIYIRMNPNRITVLSAILAAFAGCAYALDRMGLAGYITIFSGTLDTLDGRLARHTNQQSKSGAFLDSVLDRYSDFFGFAGIILMVSLQDRTPGTVHVNNYLIILSLAALLASAVISYAKERGVNLGGPEDNRGLMQRADRVMVLGLASVLDPLFYYFLKWGLKLDIPNYHLVLGFGLFLIAFLGNQTAIRRVRNLYRGFKEKPAL